MLAPALGLATRSAAHPDISALADGGGAHRECAFTISGARSGRGTCTTVAVDASSLSRDAGATHIRTLHLSGDIDSRPQSWITLGLYFRRSLRVGKLSAEEFFADAAVRLDGALGWEARTPPGDSFTVLVENLERHDSGADPVPRLVIDVVLLPSNQPPEVGSIRLHVEF